MHEMSEKFNWKIETEKKSVGKCNWSGLMLSGFRVASNPTGRNCKVTQ